MNPGDYKILKFRCIKETSANFNNIASIKEDGNFGWEGCKTSDCSLESILKVVGDFQEIYSINVNKLDIEISIGDTIVSNSGINKITGFELLNNSENDLRIRFFNGCGLLVKYITSSNFRVFSNRLFSPSEALEEAEHMEYKKFDEFWFGKPNKLLLICT